MSFKPWNPLLLTALLAGAGTTAAHAQGGVDAAKKAIELERYNAARADLKGNSSPEASFQMGRIYQMLDKPDSAAIFFNKAGGSTPFGMVAEGRALLAKDNVTAANTKFDMAAKATKNKDVNILTLITQAYAEDDALKNIDVALPYVKAAETASKGKDSYDLMVARGDLYLHTDQGGGEAMSSYDRAAMAAASNAGAYYKRGALNVRSRNGADALTNLDKAIALDPNYAPAYKEKAEMYFAAGQYDKATDSFQKFLSVAEPSTNTTAEYAAFLYLSKKYPEALEQINKVLAVDPNNFTMNRLKAYALYDTKDYAGAAAAMDKFMQVAPPSKLLPGDYSYQSKILAQTGKADDAMSVLDKALAGTTDPTQKRDLLNDRVALLTKQGKLKEAAAAQRIITAMPGSDLTDQFRLGIADTRAGEFSRADSVYNIINTAKPDYVPAYLYRAQANAGLDPETAKGTAKPYYDKYVELAQASPDKYKSGLVESYDYLALYNYNKGDKATATTYVDKALALNPSDERALAIKQNLTASGARRTAPAPKRK